MFSNQLDKAGSTLPLSPKALAGLTDPSSTGHSRLLCLQFPGANATEDEPAVGAAPKSMGSSVAIVLLLVLGAADRHHILKGELWVLSGAGSYRSSLQSLRFQRRLEEAVNLSPGVPQPLVKALRLLMRDQCNPPKFTVAPPCDLGLYHTVGSQGGGESLEDVRELLEGLQRQGDAFITHCSKTELLLRVLDVLLWQIQNHCRSSGQKHRGGQKASNFLIEQLDLMLRVWESEPSMVATRRF